MNNPQQPQPTRKIIHCDCDCFYAAIEMRDDPSLVGLPVAVGGPANRRGVIATCNYEARKFGVHSAMATGHAMKRCPDLIVLPPSFEKYRLASAQILAIYRDYTDLVEPLSLDEAFLDVTQTPQCKGSATLIAQEIRARIASSVGITASAGIAPNKFLAKIASDWRKPNGQFVITPDGVDAFVAPLPVAKLFGVGKVTAEKLHQLNIQTCADLRLWPLMDLQHQFGKFGEKLFELSRGIDNREVCSTREAKSISVEETYALDVPNLQACRQRLPGLLEKLTQRLQRSESRARAKKLFLKIRFADFQKTTVECIGDDPQQAIFEKLLETGFQRRQQPVRLLGIGVRLQGESIDQQLELFH
ncbi:MAG: polymerase [Verrucomicrobiaceae bacterium]|nr:polymerase [Verrucomicrobiaceae bacterium]